MWVSCVGVSRAQKKLYEDKLFINLREEMEGRQTNGRKYFALIIWKINFKFNKFEIYNFDI